MTYSKLSQVSGNITGQQQQSRGLHVPADSVPATSVTGASKWLKTFVPRPDASLRLICLPHAGGGASAYATWARLLPEHTELVAVQLPGREDRLAEPMIDSMTALVKILMPHLLRLNDKPYVLFGHSMGAVIAYEICQMMVKTAQQPPAHLIISGREAPRLSRNDNLHLVPDQALIEAIIRLEPQSKAVFDHPELAAISLPVIRNDYRLINGYQYQPDSQMLTLPLTAISGDDDPELLPGDMPAWQDVTDGHFSWHRFSGGHFYLKPHREGVVRIIADVMDTVWQKQQSSTG
ncbi:Linear gramicidin dehydrogenase LgrE [Vibrio aerogenes CECT 7868]|uniref:Linear gramicidin dehydrogenase LgrE n=1 Tax=Vibrio aerogenes CECT 7868 TaxID=1216006 RepID=A0A1M5Z967_9VIBR|nr:alpha/beta fold hydrolase [Vibrio aerogenes]SHI20796.1 Linear gramicidin dehydrogenase LgrE [Vibrio aerogenes CECT 7868]